jgi:hypothetical protein
MENSQGKKRREDVSDNGRGPSLEAWWKGVLVPSEAGKVSKYYRVRCSATAVAEEYEQHKTAKRRTIRKHFN